MSGTVRPLRIGVFFGEALAAPESVWSLRDAGHDVVVFVRTGSRPASTAIRGIAVAGIHPPESDLARCRADMQEMIRRCSLDLLLPLDDVALLVSSSTHLGAPVAGPRGPQLDLALDKQQQIAAADAAGLSIPPSVVIEGPGHVDWDRSFPVVVKPADAVQVDADRVRKGPTWICGDREELERVCSSVPVGVPYLVQQHITGEGRGLFGLAMGDDVFEWSGHRRLRMMNPAGSGSSACAPVDVPDELRESVRRLLRAVGWEGIFMIELLVDAQGRTWFMELNGRAWGSMALARRRGFEYPAWAVATALDPSFRPQRLPGHEVTACRNLAYELLHLLFVVRGPQTSGDVAWPSIVSTLRELLRVRRSHRLYNSRRGERRVLRRDVIWTVRRVVGSRSGRPTPHR